MSLEEDLQMVLPNSFVMIYRLTSHLFLLKFYLNTKKIAR